MSCQEFMYELLTNNDFRIEFLSKNPESFGGTDDYFIGDKDFTIDLTKALRSRYSRIGLKEAVNEAKAFIAEFVN